MKNKGISDLKIYGSGSYGGGTYDSISIMGEGKINSNVDCTNIKIYGEGQITGDLHVKDITDIKGHASIKGILEGEKLKVQGDAQFGSVSVEKAEIMGNINVKNDFNAETFKLEGGFKIHGLLNADKIEINLYWPCEVLEIGGSDIKVKKESKLSFLGIKNMIMPSESSEELTADIIEGDEIYLEYTKAKVVRGNNIELGPGCEVELVEYKGDFKKDDEAKVRSQTKA